MTCLIGTEESNNGHLHAREAENPITAQPTRIDAPAGTKGREPWRVPRETMTLMSRWKDRVAESGVRRCWQQLQ